MYVVVSVGEYDRPTSKRNLLASKAMFAGELHKATLIPEVVGFNSCSSIRLLKNVLKGLPHARLHPADFLVCELCKQAPAFVLRQAAVALNTETDE